MSAIAVVSAPPDKRPAKAYLIAIVICLAILLFPLATDALIWGSFPFPVDRQGISRLRMIPFIPWPDAPFGQY
jgi:hypothetical protein